MISPVALIGTLLTFRSYFYMPNGNRILACCYPFVFVPPVPPFIKQRNLPVAANLLTSRSLH